MQKFQIWGFKMKVLVSYSNHITENFKAVIVPFEKIKDLVKSKFNYSAGTFQNGYRNKQNYLNKSNLLILDIDEGVTINEAKKIFEPMMFIIATTKSHQKEKNGIVCDRFRVIIPCESEITLNQKDYSRMMEEVYKDYPFVDKSCKDASRFYYPSSDSEVYFYNGFCGFYWEDYWERAKKQEEIQIRLREFRKEFQQRKPKYEYDTTQKIDYIRSIMFTEKILQLLKYDERFVSGNRNNYLYSVGNYYLDIGLDDDEVKNGIEWINNQGDSIPEDELIKTIFKSLRVI